MYLSTINLYLYNNNFKHLANTNNYFDSTTFECFVDENCLNSYCVEIENSLVASLNGNCISAISQGETFLHFVATDGSNYTQSYKIVVNKILMDTLSFNQSQVELTVGQSFNFELSYEPMFCLCSIQIDCDSGLSLNQNTITAQSEGEYYVYAIDTLTGKVAQIKVIVKDIPKPPNTQIVIEFNNSYLLNNGATFENNVLTINSLTDNILTFSYKLVGDSVDDISCSIQIISANNLNYTASTIYNTVTINLVDSDTFDVVLTLKQNSLITYTFKVIIV